MTTKPCPMPNCKNRCDQGAGRCLSCYKRRKAEAAAPQIVLSAAERVEADRQESRSQQELRGLRERYKVSLSTIEQLEKEVRVVAQMRAGLETHTIHPVAPSGTSEATVVVVASDWHIEEIVGSEVGGLNVFNRDVARQRAEKFFQKSLRLTNLLRKDIRISTMVLALLGDFISNDIHDAESVEANGLQPMHAIVEAQNLLIAGITFLLEHSDLKLVVPCHSGNHARTTKTTRFNSENGHSLEFLLYQHLAAYFRAEKRVTFVIPEGPHSYLDIYGQVVRFQHGHMVKYGGGVGGIYIPVHKAIAQWNKGRHADLDVFGHFHQLVDGSNFICNGSLIGYNSFALSIKASFDKPKQALFLMDKKRGRTCLWPIYL